MMLLRHSAVKQDAPQHTVMNLPPWHCAALQYNPSYYTLHRWAVPLSFSIPTCPHPSIPNCSLPFPICSQVSQVSFPFRSQSHWLLPFATTTSIPWHQLLFFINSVKQNYWPVNYTMNGIVRFKKQLKMHIKYTNSSSQQLSFMSADCSLNNLWQQLTIPMWVHLKLPLVCMFYLPRHTAREINQPFNALSIIWHSAILSRTEK